MKFPNSSHGVLTHRDMTIELVDSISRDDPDMPMHIHTLQKAK